MAGHVQGTEGVIQYVYEGGYGSEATDCPELRTRFDGIGGAIMTKEGVASALRTENSPSPKSGHKMFLKHIVIKKLEDYFYRKGVYLFSHIARPLGCISKDEGDLQEAYLHEWVFGTEGFPWVYVDSGGERRSIRLHD